jgi:hypothetical protein
LRKQFKNKRDERVNLLTAYQNMQEMANVYREVVYGLIAKISACLLSVGCRLTGGTLVAYG